VNNLDRLVENLRTIWIGRHHLYANQVRFERPQKSYSSPNSNRPNSSRPFVPHVPNQHVYQNGTYVNAVTKLPGLQGSSIPSSPALVLDESCLVDRDLSKHAMGKVKDYSSIPNLYIILMEEGFPDVKLTYLGGLWVMFEFDKEVTKANLQKHTGINSWFHEIVDARNDFVSDERIVWVDIEGRVFTIRAKELFTWIPSFLAYKEREYSSEDDSDSHHCNKEEGLFFHNDVAAEDEINTDEEEVPETVFGSNSPSQKHANEGNGDSHSDDPFGIYDVLKKKNNEVDKTACSSLSHPPGFTPEILLNKDKNATDKDDIDCNEAHVTSANANTTGMNSPSVKSVNSFGDLRGFKFNKTGGSVLELMEGIIQVGQSSYNMDGCTKDLENIIGRQGDGNGFK
nr:hypothetical protein [Tanacetum cinerariifolium]